MMRWLSWFLKIALFLIVCAFALRNTGPVEVNFFLDAVWNAPLVIILLAFFASGALFATLFLWASLFGRRREVARLKRELSALRASLASHGERQM